MNSELSEAGKKKGRPETDAAVYAVIEQYLDGLVPKLNFRMIDDMEAGAYGFPKRILWVESITVYKIEEKSTACGNAENNCQVQRLPVGYGEKNFAGRIKYKMKQLKNDLMKVWKRKGR